MAAWRAAADHPADRAVLASLMPLQKKAPRPAGSFCCLEPAVPGKPQVEDNVAADSSGRLPPIPRIK